MKNTIKYISLAIASLILLVSFGCRKWPQNGDLDGMWQIMSIECDDQESAIPPKAYFCFERSICQIRTGRSFTANMVYEDNTILLDFPYTEISDLKPFGIDCNPVSFEILHLSGKKLIMKNNYATLTLRKF